MIRRTLLSAIAFLPVRLRISTADDMTDGAILRDFLKDLAKFNYQQVNFPDQHRFLEMQLREENHIISVSAVFKRKLDGHIETRWALTVSRDVTRPDKAPRHARRVAALLDCEFNALDMANGVRL